jgi:hypothetical protein|tara:strand:+ start:1182 stop:1592 length:411 start_codon:yes stop_codon:yes gene_type:complete
MLQIMKMIKVKLTLRTFKQAGMQDAFRRVTDKYQGYGVEVTPIHAFFSKKSGCIKFTGGQFIKVRNGHEVRYYERDAKGLRQAFARRKALRAGSVDLSGTGTEVPKNPIWNMYRMVTLNGTKDHVTKPTGKKKKAA